MNLPATPNFGCPGAAREEAAVGGARLTIGKLARLAHVGIDTLRFYETEGLLLPAGKTAAGYRLYGEDAVRRLAFIKHAQQCGLSLAEIRQLLMLKQRDSACCSDVRRLALEKKRQLEAKIETMQAMTHALGELIAICTSENKPAQECPILAALEASLATQLRCPEGTP